MTNEFRELCYQSKHWIESSIQDWYWWLRDSIRLVLFFCTVLFYCIFPTDTYITLFFMLLGTMLLDTITKIYALVRVHKAFIGVVQSHKLWIGLGSKLFVLAIMAILTGMLYRFSILPFIGNGIGTLAYGAMWLRESISICENLSEAGHKEVDFLKRFLNKKEKQIDKALEE